MVALTGGVSIVTAQEPGPEEHAGEPVLASVNIDVPEFAKPQRRLSSGRGVANPGLVEKCARLYFSSALPRYAHQQPELNG